VGDQVDRLIADLLGDDLLHEVGVFEDAVAVWPWLV